MYRTGADIDDRAGVELGGVEVTVVDHLKTARKGTVLATKWKRKAKAVSHPARDVVVGCELGAGGPVQVVVRVYFMDPLRPAVVHAGERPHPAVPVWVACSKHTELQCERHSK